MIKIICLGKLKENYLKEMVLDYTKRIRKYHKIEIIELKDEEGLEGEEEYEFTIENTGSLPASYVITLDNTCVAGKSYTIDGISINADICIPINYIK